jgi:hypothetical protein
MMKHGGESVILLILLLHLQAACCITDVSLFTSTVNTEAVHFSKISVTQFTATRRLRLSGMSTRDIPFGVKEAGVYGWKPCRLHVPIFQKIWKPQLSGAPRVCSGLQRNSVYFYLSSARWIKHTPLNNRLLITILILSFTCVKVLQ